MGYSPLTCQVKVQIRLILANFAAAKFVVASSLEKRKKIQAEKQKLLQNTNYTQKYNFIL